jgi:hypothetical protein
MLPVALLLNYLYYYFISADMDNPVENYSVFQSVLVISFSALYGFVLGLTLFHLAPRAKITSALAVFVIIYLIGVVPLALVFYQFYLSGNSPGEIPYNAWIGMAGIFFWLVVFIMTIFTIKTRK